MRFPLLSLLAGEAEDRIAPTSLTCRTSAVACGVIAVTLASALPCSAQVRVDVTPLVGAYLPRTDFVTSGPWGLSCLDSFSALGCAGAVRQRNAPIVGGQITGWLGKRFAVDVSVGYSPSGMVSRPLPAFGGYVEPGGGGDTSAHIVTGSARFLVTLTPPTVRSSLYLVAGWAFVTHGGDGYAATVRIFQGYVRGPTDWGPVVGVGARFAVTPTLAPRAEMQYKPRADVAHAQGEFVLSLGLSATLFESRGRSGLAPQQGP